MAQPQPEDAAMERRREQQTEYGTYVANQAIYVGTALAYNPGDPVPASNVAALGYEKDGLVDKVSTSKSSSKSSSSAKSEG